MGKEYEHFSKIEMQIPRVTGKMFRTTSNQGNANKNYSEVSPHPSWKDYHPKIKTNGGKVVEKRVT